MIADRSFSLRYHGQTLEDLKLTGRADLEGTGNGLDNVIRGNRGDNRLDGAWGDDVLTVLMGTLPEADLTRHMQAADALVVMKIGRNLGKVRRALEAAGRATRAWLVECAAMPDQRVMPLAEVGETVPYFSIIVVHGQGRRP